MFEQSVDIIHQRRRPWTFALATAVELGLLAAMLIVPLVYIAPVKLPPPPSPTVAYLGIPKVERSRTFQSRQASVTRPQLRAIIFQAPARIPTKVAEINDLGAPVMDLGLGVAGSVGDPSGVPGGVITGVVGSVPVVDSGNGRPIASQAPIKVGGGVQAANLITKVLPKYPETAKQARQSGTVEVVAVIGIDGHVREIRSTAGPILLRAAAVEAIRQWVYRPTLLNGQPVEVIAPVLVHFTLSN